MAAKLGILSRYPRYAATIWRELQTADVAHVRCPANIGLLGAVMLSLSRQPRVRWIKYAGNWGGTGEPLSYSFQRWWLSRRFHRGVVTVNGTWPNQPSHVHSFLNPSLTGTELGDANRIAFRKEISGSIRLLYVGRVETPKGARRAVQIAGHLLRQGVALELDVVGDGPERTSLEDHVRQHGLSAVIRFHGWLPRHAIAQFYSSAHCMLLPCSSSEGWPKVLSEGMAYGVVPVAGAVSSIPQMLGRFRAGCAFPPNAAARFAEAIRAYSLNPRRWKDESQRAVAASSLFTYDAYLDAVRTLLGCWKQDGLSGAEGLPATA